MKNLKKMFTNLKDLLLNNKKNFCIVIIVLFIITVAILISSIILNPMNAKITRKNYDNVVEKIRKNASKDDYEKVQAVIAMAEMASWGEDKDKIDLLEGKSFNKMIKTIQKNIEQGKKEIEYQKSIAKEKSKIRDEYFEVLSWSYDIIKIDQFEKGVKIYLEARNKKNVDIEAFEGVLIVKDKLNNVILESKLTANIEFPKNSEEVFNWTISEIDNYTGVREISKFNGRGQDLTFYFDLEKIIVNGKEI